MDWYHVRQKDNLTFPYEIWQKKRTNIGDSKTAFAIKPITDLQKYLQLIKLAMSYLKF